MGRCGCGACQCSIGAGSVCLVVTGAGTAADPYLVSPVISPDAGNALSCRATGLFAGTGAWTSWAPTLANITVGNGVTTALFAREGRLIAFELKFVMGSTSAMGSNPTFTLPVTAAARYAVNIDHYGTISIFDTAPAIYSGMSFVSSTTIGLLGVYNASATYATITGFTSAIPFTWGTGDAFVVKGFYESAA